MNAETVPADPIAATLRALLTPSPWDTLRAYELSSAWYAARELWHRTENNSPRAGEIVERAMLAELIDPEPDSLPDWT